MTHGTHNRLRKTVPALGIALALLAGGVTPGGVPGACTPAACCCTVGADPEPSGCGQGGCSTQAPPTDPEPATCRMDCCETTPATEMPALPTVARHQSFSPVAEVPPVPASVPARTTNLFRRGHAPHAGHDPPRFILFSTFLC